MHIADHLKNGFHNYIAACMLMNTSKKKKQCCGEIIATAIVFLCQVKCVYHERLHILARLAVLYTCMYMHVLLSYYGG